jgi:sterol desaturase/sphingolipid hydroxylase (fatty acid hydroxylase superfamily)
MRKWLTPAIATVAFGAFVLLETKRPLRKRREDPLQRSARNLAMAGLTAAAVSALQGFIVRPVAEQVESRRLGLLARMPLPPVLRRAAGVLLLDYTLWWWHWVNHRVPFFWRFHLVHHIDRDLDASTAIRFHFGEMSLSLFYRAAQIGILGVDRQTLSIWQAMLFVSIFFHHSNIRLTEDVDRALSRIVVTPRMHGIHHSDFAGETNSNWSSLFSWWDFLHGTFREDIPQRSIEIGVPAYQHPDDVTLGKSLAVPFVEQRDDWMDSEGFRRIDRDPAPLTRRGPI